MSKRLLFLLLAAAMLTYASCKKESEPGDRYYSEATRGYYPLQVGRYVVYDVDSTIWSDFDCSKRTRHLQMRYTVSDTFTDNQGRPSFQIDVLQRNADTALWQTSQVFYATPTATGLETVMQNLRMEKLIFPVAEGKTWIGNRAIDTTDATLRQYSGWVYKYRNFLKTYNNGRVNFPNTVTVDAVNDSLNSPELVPSAYAERNYFREVYGYDVGLVYREATYWTYDPGDPTTSCRKGFSVVMRAVEYQ